MPKEALIRVTYLNAYNEFVVRVQIVVLKIVFFLCVLCAIIFMLALLEAICNRPTQNKDFHLLVIATRFSFVIVALLHAWASFLAFYRFGLDKKYWVEGQYTWTLSFLLITSIAVIALAIVHFYLPVEFLETNVGWHLWDPSLLEEYYYGRKVGPKGRAKDNDDGKFVKKSIDEIQIRYQCCGFISPADWKDVAAKKGGMRSAIVDGGRSIQTRGESIKPAASNLIDPSQTMKGDKGWLKKPILQPPQHHDTGTPTQPSAQSGVRIDDQSHEGDIHITTDSQPPQLRKFAAGVNRAGGKDWKGGGFGNEDEADPWDMLLSRKKRHAHDESDAWSHNNDISPKKSTHDRESDDALQDEHDQEQDDDSVAVEKFARARADADESKSGRTKLREPEKEFGYPVPDSCCAAGGGGADNPGKKQDGKTTKNSEKGTTPMNTGKSATKTTGHGSTTKKGQFRKYLGNKIEPINQASQQDAPIQGQQPAKGLVVVYGAAAGSNMWRAVDLRTNYAGGYEARGGSCKATSSMKGCQHKFNQNFPEVLKILVWPFGLAGFLGLTCNALGWTIYMVFRSTYIVEAPGTGGKKHHPWRFRDIDPSISGGGGGGGGGGSGEKGSGGKSAQKGKSGGSAKAGKK